jgi:hypothetical protein
MVSTETPDDGEPPQFNFRQWIARVAAVIACIIMATLALACFYEAPDSAQRAKAHRDIMETLCSGYTLHVVTEQDRAECGKLGIGGRAPGH